LLPVVARQELGFDATGYGIVLGSLGLGAVGGAMLLPRLRRALSIDRLTAAATLVFAGATLALAYLRVAPLVLVSLVGGGIAWMAMTSSVNVAAQTAAPAWMRARAVSLYILVFQGVLAVGGFTWGLVAQQFGPGPALTGAALVLIAGMAATVRWPLHLAQHLNLAPSGHWPDPQVTITPEPGDGPVLVTVEYRVPAARAREFNAVMAAMGRFRRREGAVRWDVFRDLDDPDRYLETFVVPSWGEHLRQHARVTADDQALEARRDALLQPGVAPIARHLLAAHVFEDRPAAEPAGVELSMSI
jgi:MFS family permease